MKFSTNFLKRGSRSDPKLKKRYFGLSGLSLTGGIFSGKFPRHRYEVELIDSLGEVVASVKADKPSPKEKEIPHGHGFSIPIPGEWLVAVEDGMTFQFRVVETGDLFPKEPRSLPVEKLMRSMGKHQQSGPGSAARLRRLTRELSQRSRPLDFIVAIHAMTRTGAPLIALELIRKFREQHGKEILVLCLGARENLQEEFREQSSYLVEHFGACLALAPQETHEFLGFLKNSLTHPVALVNSLCSTDIAIACSQAGLNVHTLLHEYPYAFEKDWCQKLISSSQSITFPSQDVYDSFLRERIIRPGHPEENCSFFIQPQGCYNLEKPPLDQNIARAFSAQFREINHLKGRDRLIMACGTIDSRKGFDWFTRFIIFYMARSPHAFTTHFLWVGPINEEELFFHSLHDLRRAGGIGQFHHLDQIDDVRLPMQEADLFFLCSRIDPFPSVVLEAMAEGIPVVAFDRDHGISELIRQTGFGQVIPYQNNEAALLAVEHLLGEDGFPQGLGPAGREYISKHFDYSNYAKVILEWILQEKPLPLPQINRKESVTSGIAAPSSAPRPIYPELSEITGEEPDNVLSSESRLKIARRRGLEFLAFSQQFDGEFPTYIWLGDDPRSVQFDSSPFVTSLISHSLTFCGPRATPMLERALEFLLDQMEPQGVWRYYSNKSFKHPRVPPDLDDTSSISFILRKCGHPVPDNAWIFEETCNRTGLFLTWVLPEQSENIAFHGYLAALGKLASQCAPEKPAEFRNNPRYMAPNDPVPAGEVDATVNANVILYLGETELTERAISFLIDVIRNNREAESTEYYCDPMATYYMITRAGLESSPALLKAVAPLLVQRIEACLESDLPSVSPLNLALALCVLTALNPDSPLIEAGFIRLLDAQAGDGSWPRGPFYSGPPGSPFWGSEELTTGFAVEGISRLLDARGAHDSIKGPCEIYLKSKVPTVDIDFDSEEFTLNPYPYFRQLRETYPVVYNERTDKWLVSCYRDIGFILEARETFSSAANSFENILMGNDDAPSHTAVHGLVRSMFDQECLSLLQNNLRSWVRPLLREFKDRGHGEFLEELAMPIPMQVICFLLGVKNEMRPTLVRWGELLELLAANAKGDVLADEDRETLKECHQFFRDHVADEKSIPSGSPLRKVIDIPAELNLSLDLDQKMEIAVVLLSAGTVTTTNLLATCAYILAGRPDLFQLLKADPRLIPGFIEEVLRFESPGQSVGRRILTNVTVAGQKIPAGQSLLLLLGSANRDEAVFPFAERFIYNRRPNRHLAFGRGPHACAGMAISRLEAKIILELMVEIFDRIDYHPAHGPAPLRSQFVVRRPDNVHLQFS